jgi:hypothetical protein
LVRSARIVSYARVGSQLQYRRQHQHLLQHWHRPHTPPCTSFSLFFVPSFNRSLLLPSGGPDMLPTAIPLPLGICSYSAPEAKEAQRRDKGHNANSRSGHVRCEDRQTKDRRRCRDRNGHAGRDAICHAIFEFAGAGSLDSDGRGKGGAGLEGESERI